MKQTTLFKTAIIVHILFSIMNISIAWPFLINGPNVASIGQGIPHTLLVLGGLFGVADLISGYGASVGQKWGVWLTVIIDVIGGLTALPGILIAPTNQAQVLAFIGVLAPLFVVFGLMWRRQTPI